MSPWQKEILCPAGVWIWDIALGVGKRVLGGSRKLRLQ